MKLKKRVFSLGILAAMGIAVLMGCGGKKNENNIGSHKIMIGTDSSVGADILKTAKKELKKEGYVMEIKEYSKNDELNGDLDVELLDASIQNKSDLEAFVTKSRSNFVVETMIYYEPFVIFSETIRDLDHLKQGAVIAIPNDTIGKARALSLLETTEGLAGRKDLKIKEMKAEKIPGILKDVDLAVLNGIDALKAGLKVDEDALSVEDSDSAGAKNYGTALVIYEGNRGMKSLKVLTKALKSDKVKRYIKEEYNGAIMPLF